MTDPAVVRAALTPVIQAAVLDAFKLGVGMRSEASRADVARVVHRRPCGTWVRR